MVVVVSWIQLSRHCTNKQTNKQTSKQANKQTMQTNAASNQHANKRSDRASLCSLNNAIMAIQCIPSHRAGMWSSMRTNCGAPYLAPKNQLLWSPSTPRPNLEGRNCVFPLIQNQEFLFISDSWNLIRWPWHYQISSNDVRKPEREKIDLLKLSWCRLHTVLFVLY